MESVYLWKTFFENNRYLKNIVLSPLSRKIEWRFTIKKNVRALNVHYIFKNIIQGCLKRHKACTISCESSLSYFTKLSILKTGEKCDRKAYSIRSIDGANKFIYRIHFVLFCLSLSVPTLWRFKKVGGIPFQLMVRDDTNMKQTREK